MLLQKNARIEFYLNIKIGSKPFKISSYIIKLKEHPHELQIATSLQWQEILIRGIWTWPTIENLLSVK